VPENWRTSFGQAFPHKVEEVFYLNGRRSLPLMTTSSACERCCQTQTRKPWSALSRSRKFKTELRQQKMKQQNLMSRTFENLEQA
jgi:hypothetical protein